MLKPYYSTVWTTQPNYECLPETCTLQKRPIDIWYSWYSPLNIVGCLWKWTKPPRWPTKMADSCPTPTPTANPFRDTPFMCTVVCWQSPTSPTLPPILLCWSLRVQLRAKTKTKYQSFSLHSYEQVNMNTSAVTTLYLPAEFAWAPMGRKPQEKYKYTDASWPSTRYSSMPYYPSSLPSPLS